MRADHLRRGQYPQANAEIGGGWSPSLGAEGGRSPAFRPSGRSKGQRGFPEATGASCRASRPLAEGSLASILAFADTLELWRRFHEFGYDWGFSTGAHGFVRAPDGTITKIDVSGASATNTTGINSVGTVLGYYVDANGVVHGFIRATNGTITTFDAPGAGTTPNHGQGTFPFGTNPQGTITGLYVDTNNLSHGFVRTPTGTTSTIDAPNAGTSAGQGTILFVINQAGALAGNYVDANNVNHGLLVTGE